jgi:hypothetical protein
MTDTMTFHNIDLPSRNRAGGKDNTVRPNQTTKKALSRKPFGIGHMFTWSFLLRMTDTMTSHNIVLSSWDTLYILFYVATAPRGPGSPHYRGFTIILRHISLGKNPLDEWSVRRRDLYLTTNNTHKGEISMTPTGFEPAMPQSERAQTHALDRASTRIDHI